MSPLLLIVPNVRIELSEKRTIFSDMRPHSPSSVRSRTSQKKQPAQGSVDAAIRAELMANEAGKVFSPVDFVHLGSRAAIDKVLSRLTAAGTIRRIARGLYDVPRKHAILGALLPSADDIAKAIAGKASLRLQPSGAYAANLLGLTEQVPMKLAFLTDGVSRTVHIGNQSILLKHTTPRNMAIAGRISGLVIQALRHFKQAHIDDQIVAKLRAKLSAEDKTVLLADAPLAPAWIADVMRRIAQDKE